VCNKKQVQTKNIKLEELRKVPVKTVEEQIAFLDAKFPKSKKEKYFIKTLWKAIKNLALFILIMFGLYKIIGFFSIVIPLWAAVTFIFVFPLLVNLVLIPFHLENDNILIMLRGKWFRK
jgi:hypothetical protein